MTSPRTSMIEFLGRYRDAVLAIARLSRDAGLDRISIRDALLDRPLSVPAALRRAPGAVDITARLRQLASDRDSTDADPRAVDDAMTAIIREIFEPRAAMEGMLRGGSGGGGGQRAKPPAAAAPPPMPPPPAPPPSAPPRTGSARPPAGNGGSRDRPRQPGLLGVEPAAVAKSPPSAPGAAAPPGDPVASGPREQRWINAELEGRPPTLEVGKRYTLAFDVDVGKRETADTAVRIPEALLFPTGVEEVSLTVQLDSEDFDIAERDRPLVVPRTGRSAEKARFAITPRHDGPCAITATFHKEGNFVQQMELTFRVGEATAKPVEVKATGRPPAAASVLRPRDVSISISRAPGDEYDCVVVGPVSGRARLRIQQAQLASAIEAAREDLLRVVTHEDSTGNPVFQTSITIPPEDEAVALKTMAQAGARLFQQIFSGPAAGDDSKRIGNFLREIATDETARLKLQIVAESAPVPWGLLYMGDASSRGKLSWSNFLGMRHVIEQIPLQNTLAISDCAIPSDEPELAVSINMNTGIDAQMQATFVAQQRKYWTATKTARQRVRVKARTKRDEVVKALASNRTTDQILYFYCHAESVGLGAPGGPDASCLVLSGDERLSLRELNLEAPMSSQLRGKPLVFINACESAQLSPTFYDGFVPYFMAKGARGVIGTECKTPALFAAEWAKRFFERFLDGAPLGETFLELRREFLEKDRNPLGLLYAVHCDGDTQIEPALVRTPAR